MRVYVTNGPRNGLHIGGKVGPCPGSRRRWVFGSVHAFYQAVHAAITYRPRFQVRTRPSYTHDLLLLSTRCPLPAGLTVRVNPWVLGSVHVFS